MEMVIPSDKDSADGDEPAMMPTSGEAAERTAIQSTVEPESDSEPHTDRPSSTVEPNNAFVVETINETTAVEALADTNDLGVVVESDPHTVVAVAADKPDADDRASSSATSSRRSSAHHAIEDLLGADGNIDTYLNTQHAISPVKGKEIVIEAISLEKFSYEKFDSAVKESVLRLTVRKRLETEELDWLQSNPNSEAWATVVKRVNDTIDTQDILDAELNDSIQFLDYIREMDELHNQCRDVEAGDETCLAICNQVIDEVVTNYARSICNYFFGTMEGAGNEVDRNILNAFKCQYSKASDATGYSQVVCGSLQRGRSNLNRAHNRRRKAASHQVKGANSANTSAHIESGEVDNLSSIMDKALQQHQIYNKFNHFYVDEVLTERHQSSTSGNGVRGSLFGVSHRCVSLQRQLESTYVDKNQFDSLIASEREFISGWRQRTDNPGAAHSKSSFLKRAPRNSLATGKTTLSLGSSDGLPSCLQLFSQKHRRQSVLAVGTRYSRLFVYAVPWVANRALESPVLVAASITVPKAERCPIVDIKVGTPAKAFSLDKILCCCLFVGGKYGTKSLCHIVRVWTYQSMDNEPSAQEFEEAHSFRW
jgi:hypothetical protein